VSTLALHDGRQSIVKTYWTLEQLSKIIVAGSCCHTSHWKTMLAHQEQLRCIMKDQTAYHTHTQKKNPVNAIIDIQKNITNKKSVEVISDV